MSKRYPTPSPGARVRRRRPGGTTPQLVSQAHSEKLPTRSRLQRLARWAQVRMSKARDLGHWDRFLIEQRLIFKTHHWLIVTRPNQITLGSCTILLKRPAQGMSQLRRREAADLNVAIQKFEATVTRAFHPAHFNYVVSMQHDRYVHLHALPRYDAPVEFDGTQWTDKDWPFFLDFPRSGSTPDWLSDRVTETLRDAWRRSR